MNDQRSDREKIEELRARASLAGESSADEGSEVFEAFGYNPGTPSRELLESSDDLIEDTERDDED